MPATLRRHTLTARVALMGLVALAGLGAAPAARAAGAYDPQADAPRDIQQALADAARAKVPVLIVFGADWCPDCRVLDLALHTGASAPLVARDFRVVKVDVGRFDHNVALAERYGVPLKKGIPAVAVVSPEGRVLYATRGGELADARSMGDAGIYDFFERVSHQALKAPVASK